MVESSSSEQYVSERYDSYRDSYDTIMLRLDATPELESIKHFLSRDQYDKKSETWFRPEGVQPLLAEEGINEIMLELHGRMGISKALSHLSANDIKRFTRETGEVVLEFLFNNYDVYGIQAKNFNKIYSQIIHNVEIFLSRAKNGITNELISKQFLQKEIVSKQGAQNMQEQQQNNRGFGFNQMMKR